MKSVVYKRNGFWYTAIGIHRRSYRFELWQEATHFAEVMGVE